MTSSSLFRVLVLGGSSEATALVRALADRPELVVTLSFAGRTTALADQPVATRVGGFGGVDGLERHLRDERIDLLVDATHPFAAQMARHAREATDRIGCKLVKVSRAAWQAQPGDRWHEVETIAGVVEALGTVPRRVFLTIGSLQLAAFARAPQHHYLVRTIDPVGKGHGLPDATFIIARGPFEVAAEENLIRHHRLEILVTKNSGGAAAAAKLVAARHLALPVILLKRPGPAAAAVDVETALVEIDAHVALARRGV